MLTIRDGDLKDLQQKYAQALSIQERQFKLLDTMQERLEKASDFLLEFNDDSGNASLSFAKDIELNPLQARDDKQSERNMKTGNKTKAVNKGQRRGK